jgi:uncharacterized protein (DUF2236 family)
MAERGEAAIGSRNARFLGEFGAEPDRRPAASPGGPRRPAAGGRGVDFASPRGEPALVPADSVSWRVFKNPMSLYVGGVAAVILELAEPRVRSGVWDHSDFRRDPLGRMERTGLAAMLTVYGARSRAERMIAGVTRLHARVRGVTPDGVEYEALEPELMNWVQATASFGFLNAYHRFARRLSRAERDAFYAEARPASRLYGATGAPASEAACAALFDAMLPALEASPIVFEFLEIMRRTPALPLPLRSLQGPLIRAAIALVPSGVRTRLGLDARRFALGAWERRTIRLASRIAERVPLPSAPPAQACTRLGLPANHLYGR